MSPAKLNDLPPEIFIRIGTFLDEDDLLAIRLTCKECNTKAHEAHLTAVFQCRRVYFAPASFGNLSKIGGHPSKANLRVRDIIISCSMPYQTCRDAIVGDTPASKNEKVGGGPRGVLSVVSDTSRRLIPDVEQMQATGDEVVRLAQAFAKLPNIRSIRIERDDSLPLSRSELNLYFPDLKLTPGNRIPKELGEIRGEYIQYDAAVSFWDIPVSAAIRAGSKLETLIDSHDPECPEGIPLDWFACSQTRLEAFRDKWSCLRVLKFDVDASCALKNRSEADSDSETESYPNKTRKPEKEQLNSRNPAFCTWLESLMGLEELELSSNCLADAEDDYEAYILPTTTGLPNLKKLSLRIMKLDFRNLCNFLRFCKSTLCTLSISECSLENPVSSWFRLLKHIRTQCTNIKVLSLSPSLRDYPQDKYSELYLPWIEARKNPVSRKLIATVGAREDNRTNYMLEKDLGRILDANFVPEEFWNSLTNGGWVRDGLGDGLMEITLVTPRKEMFF
ncbi:hypothetical protein TWF694_006381 [Orbilia ellipsospora]|uniref:F-box domain-containing protein n=1 Tax=Orbilia ellipsospora TaxID=2528407 RepID=A0AAV9XLC7_9PEZI